MTAILHIIAAPVSGGVEAFVRDLACTLAGQGHNIHVVFIDRAADLGRDVEFEATFLSRLEAHGVRYSFLGHQVRRKPWLGALRLRRLVRNHGIDLIHSHLAYGNFFSAAIPGTPLVYTHHSEKMRFPKYVWTYFRWRAARFIGISEICADNLGRFSKNPSKVVLVPNGIEMLDIRARSPEVISPNGPVSAICVGRITPQKNYPMLAHAIAGLSAEMRTRLTVDVFGEGDAGIVATCNKILHDAGVRNEVLRFRGINSKIRQILHEYDIFLMSSDWEGLPIALIEATAAGLPTIVTDVGGCRELVDGGPSGIVVPPSNSLAFLNALMKMMNTPELRETFSHNAKRSAKAYSVAEATKRHLHVYEEAIGL